MDSFYWKFHVKLVLSHRFHDHWRFVTQRLSFLAALLVYLESERLIEREETAQLLGGKNSYLPIVPCTCICISMIR